MNYPTDSGRTIAEIAEWADNLAGPHLANGMDDAAASAVISVACTQVVGPASSAWSPTLKLTGHLMRGQSTGASSARWSLENFDHSDRSRSEHAARLRAVADVIEASTVNVACLTRAMTELRAYADVYDPARV